MSSFLYPNSATRKMYGQAGKVLQRQNKRFASIQQRLEQDARNRELGIKETAAEILAAEKLRTQKLIRKIIIIGAVVLVIVVTLLLII